MDAICAHLKLESFQKRAIELDTVDSMLDFIARSLSSTSQAPVTPVSEPGDGPIIIPPEVDADVKTTFEAMRRSLFSALSDVSAAKDFQDRHASLTTNTGSKLRRWIAGAHNELQALACIMIGNMACSKTVCIDFVSRDAIHQDLIKILSLASDERILYSALGFLRNLALPAENKSVLGAAGIIPPVVTLTASEVAPQLTQPAASLLRQLLSGCMDNHRRLLQPLGQDKDSPAAAKSQLTLILAAYEKSDDPTLKFEISRICVSVLRQIETFRKDESAGRSEDIANLLLKRIYIQQTNFTAPLTMMVTQSKHPIIRSEGWFALALMTRTDQGAELVAELIRDPNVWTALEEAMNSLSIGKDDAVELMSPVSVSASTFEGSGAQSKDGDNALVLITELLRRVVSLVTVMPEVRQWADHVTGRRYPE